MDANEHVHCVSCIQGFSCRQQAACRVIYCSNGCGVFTHSCKMEDHMKEVCPLARVACPNQLVRSTATVRAVIAERWEQRDDLPVR